MHIARSNIRICPMYLRTTFSKRKLTTKVLLPKTLYIPGNSIAEGQAKYILCAVQNHLGNSAHGGHYIANVLDWKTGVWYEFNDEDVTILDSGPASSFEPFENEDSTYLSPSNGHREVGGSQDAYNLLYVRQSYLSDQCRDEMQKKLKSESAEASTDREVDDNVISSINEQRRTRYESEVEYLTKEKFKEKRILARRNKILTEMMSPKSQLICATTRPTTEYIWVDSNFLRRFFSCQDDLEDLFRSAHCQSSVLRRESFVCEHLNGLHPRVAREGMSKLFLVRSSLILCAIFHRTSFLPMFSGKFLPLIVYDKLEAIVKHEYRMFIRDQRTDMTSTPSLTLFDCKFDDRNHTIMCQTCGVAYQQKIKQKIDVLNVSIHSVVNNFLFPYLNDLICPHKHVTT